MTAPKAFLVACWDMEWSASLRAAAIGTRLRRLQIIEHLLLDSATVVRRHGEPDIRRYPGQSLLSASIFNGLIALLTDGLTALERDNRPRAI